MNFLMSSILGSHGNVFLPSCFASVSSAVSAVIQSGVLVDALGHMAGLGL